MAVDNFTYQGINRAVSDYSGAKMCEELINLRPTDGGLVPVKPFKVKLANFPYAKLFVHKTTDGDKYLAVKKGTGTVSVYQIEIDDEHGTYTEGANALFSVENITTGSEDYVIEHLYYAAAGNIVLFSVCAPDVVKFENHAFTWERNAYTKTDANAPEVTYEITDTAVELHDPCPEISSSTAPAEMVSTVESTLNAMQENNPEVCLGPVIIATAFKTKDGNTFWTGNWQVYDPVPTINANSPSPYKDANNLSTWEQSQYTDFMTKYTYGYTMGIVDAEFKYDDVIVYGTNVTLTFDALTDPWDKDTSIIQSVEVYCSKPQLYMDPSGAYEGFKDSNTYTELILPHREYSDMELGGQILYHQASIQLSSLAGSDQTITLTFGGNIQVTEDTLDVDSGALERYGRLLAYNARFHYFDSMAITRVGDLGMPTFNIMPATWTPTTTSSCTSASWRT